MNENKIPVVAVVGPTASGKTRLAIDICKKLHGEVISCDSMQLYKQLSIGTAKATPQEQAEVKHHLIDLIEPHEEFSVAEYANLTHRKIKNLNSQGILPVLAGGTGLYLRTVLQNIEFTEQQKDQVYCEELVELANQRGNEYVHKMLEDIDPVAAANIHFNNLVRVVRALEVYHTTGVTMSEQQRRSVLNDTPYDSITIGITYRNRNTLYDRINKRVDIMVEQGLLEEARMALSMPLSKTASNAIGYKELKPYFDGVQTLEQSLNNLKQSSRNYAKRQLTWFKKEEGLQWFYVDDYDSYDILLDSVINTITKHFKMDTN